MAFIVVTVDQVAMALIDGFAEDYAVAAGVDPALIGDIARIVDKVMSLFLDGGRVDVALVKAVMTVARSLRRPELVAVVAAAALAAKAAFEELKALAAVRVVVPYAPPRDNPLVR